jgi:hypothetical protein
MTFVLTSKANLQADCPLAPSCSGLSLAAVRYFLCLVAGFGSEHAHFSEGANKLQSWSRGSGNKTVAVKGGMGGKAE